MSFQEDAEYAEIFERRGADYHAAMCRWPRARRNEFAHLLDFAGIHAGQRLLDAPAGGGYLADYLDVPAEVHYLETAGAFVRESAPGARRRMVLGSLEAMPFATGGIDRVLSLAGLHHVEDKTAFFREARRVLADGGALCCADVHAASPVRRFLDEFVGAHNSTGHSGWYFDARVTETIAACGFRITAADLIRYSWEFDSAGDMAAYCALLFGVAGVTEQQTLAAIDRYLGWEADARGARMNWALYFVRAEPA